MIHFMLTFRNNPTVNAEQLTLENLIQFYLELACYISAICHNIRYFFFSFFFFFCVSGRKEANILSYVI